MSDETEGIRRVLVDAINAEPGSRGALEAEHGQVWDTAQLTADFEVRGFMAPFVVVRRLGDGAVGTLMFQHRPRFYFGFSPDGRQPASASPAVESQGRARANLERSIEDARPDPRVYCPRCRAYPGEPHSRECWASGRSAVLAPLALLVLSLVACGGGPSATGPTAVAEDPGEAGVVEQSTVTRGQPKLTPPPGCECPAWTTNAWPPPPRPACCSPARPTPSPSPTPAAQLALCGVSDVRATHNTTRGCNPHYQNCTIISWTARAVTTQRPGDADWRTLKSRFDFVGTSTPPMSWSYEDDHDWWAHTTDAADGCDVAAYPGGCEKSRSDVITYALLIVHGTIRVTAWVEGGPTGTERVCEATPVELSF